MRLQNENKLSENFRRISAAINNPLFIALFVLLFCSTSFIQAQDCTISSGTSIVNPQGGNQSFPLNISQTCEEPYIFGTYPSWINTLDINGNTLSFSSSPNTTGSTRTGNIVINSEFDTEFGSIFVRQASIPQPPPTPNATITIISNGCNEATFQRSGTPPANVAWYWQDSSSGISTSAASASTTYTVSSSGTYYLRARRLPNGPWSSSSQATPSVTVLTLNGGSIEFNDGNTSSNICYGTSPRPIVNASSASSGDTYSYQWQSAPLPSGPYTDISGATGLGYTPPAQTTNQWFRREVTSCSGQTATSNSVTSIVQSEVTIATGSDNGRCGTGTVVLNATPGANANSIRWYAAASGGSVLATNPSFTTPSLSTSTTYYAESYNTTTGCFSSARLPIEAQIVVPENWYLDVDNDGFYPINGLQSNCGSPGAGWTTNIKTAGDCDDDDPELNPNTLWYPDADQDGFADIGGTPVQQCEQPPGNWTRNENFPPCTDLVSGNGNTPSGTNPGSFEGALAVVTENARNGNLGTSGWTATAGTPDTFLPPYLNTADVYLDDTFEASPNAGVVAGALRYLDTAESFQTTVDGLTVGVTYVVEFYQSNASRVPLAILLDELSGFWKVSFAGQVQDSELLVPAVNDVFWKRNRLEFIANATSSSLGFQVESTASIDTASFPVYMLIDGVRVYEKTPEGEPSYACSDIIVQTFCTADQVDAKIQDLNSPFAQTLGWFSQPVGGQRFFENDLLSELPTSIIWADDGSDDSRIAVEIIFDEGMPVGNQQQFFDIITNPRIANIQPAGADIEWYDSFTSTTALDKNNLLSDGSTYFASLNGSVCRLEVTVTVSAPQPEGDTVQEFCSTSNATISDIAVLTTNPSYTLEFYAAETGGSPLDPNTLLSNNTTYYVAQNNGALATVDRLPISISIIDIEAQARVTQRDVLFGLGNTIADLSNFFGFDASVLWYDSLTGGTAYGPSFALGNETYYARIGQGLCPSLDILEVSVSIGDVVDPELVRCVKFLPQPGDRYVISGWVREEPLMVDQTVTKIFNDEIEVKQAFVRLLEHIASKVLNENSTGGLPIAYVVSEDPDAALVNADAIVPYIKNAVSNKLTVHNFRFETEIVGGHNRAVGFSFALIPGDNVERFRYLTPLVTLRFPYLPGMPDFPQNYRYPIRNRQFTTSFDDVSIIGGNFNINSTFTAPITSGSSDLIEISNKTLSQTASGIDSTVDFITYKENPESQSIAYSNTRIELSYTDESGAPLEVDGIGPIVEFNPKGPVIDGWQRISGEFTIPGIGNAAGPAATMTVTLKTENRQDGDINGYFDDVRVHPFNSNMKSFVYDPISQRLMAELDENNYATFYEYDIEGGLVRVKKETERGVYTIQETRSGNSKLNRSTFFDN